MSLPPNLSPQQLSDTQQLITWLLNNTPLRYQGNNAVIIGVDVYGGVEIYDGDYSYLPWDKAMAQLSEAPPDSEAK